MTGEGKRGAWPSALTFPFSWKAVRALDASDLEQWLEESIPAQIWLAKKLAMPVSGFETLDRCWERWAAASDPKMTPEIFEPSITAYRATFKAWLAKQSERPFVVAADSKDEALAFLACLFQDSDIAAQSKDLAAVFESAETLRTLASSSSPFMPIVCTEEAECELAAMYRRFHCIVVRPRNAVVSEPDIAIDLLGHEAFEKALAAMGIEGNDAERLARESGRSPTILRPALQGRRDQDAPMGQGCGDREKPGPDGFSRGMARKIQCRLRDRFHTRGLDLSRDRKEHCPPAAIR